MNEEQQQIPALVAAEHLGQLGLEQIAYIKPALLEGQVAFAIHAANGAPLGMAPTREVARAAALQHGLMALSVH